MVTVGIHPNEFGVLNGHPNKIPTNEMLGDVVQNCRTDASLKLRPTHSLTRVNCRVATMVKK